MFLSIGSHQSAVGIYNISVLLATVVVLPLAALNRIFPSVASQLYEAGQRAELETVYATVTRWGLTVSLPIAVFGIVLGSEVLTVFGSGFSTGELVLAFFLLGESTTSPVNPWPMLLYGLLGGVLLVLIRQFSGHAEGAVFAALLVNLVNPLLDRIVPRVRGLEEVSRA